VIVVAAASGTSLDAIDVAAVELRGEGDELSLRVLDERTVPWPEELRAGLLALLPPATAPLELVCALDQQIGQTIADAVLTTVETLARPADLVVSPGQTVFHDVRGDRCLGTLQLGQPAWIAERTGLPVLSDLRARDVAAGGHGAPLMSIFDELWLAGPGAPRATLNLGGIANVTVVRESAPVIAWDTGPGNCLIDVAAGRATNGVRSCDLDGELARAGTVDADLLAVLLDHPYFALGPPASTGRETFSAELLESALARVAHPVTGPDLVATVTELTAVTVAQALAAYDVSEVVASGGGVHNPALLDALRRCLGEVRLDVSDERGLSADGKEVVMWALLGYLGWHGLPGTNGSTGAPPRILGRITPGAEALHLPEPASPVRRLRVVA
jgi:anhydro-N-acetylmuramic acid kinase